VCVALGPYGPRGTGGEDTAFEKIGGEGVKVDVTAWFLFVGACGCKSVVLGLLHPGMGVEVGVNCRTYHSATP